MKFLTKYLSLPECYDRATATQNFLQLCLPFCVIIAIIWALFIAPTDFQQGEAYRIIYIHVPCALLSLGLYLVIGILAFVFLVWRIKIAGLLIPCIVKVGIVFSALALITGSIWGKPMWGTWWIWDARLTSTLVLFFLYLGILVLHNALQHQNSADRAAAILGLLGTVNLPIVHYSVTWWNTLHQGATVTRFWAPTIAITMLKPLLFMLLTFVLYTVVMVCMLLQQSIQRHEANTRWLARRKQQNVR